METCLVLGGNGFIGSHIADLLSVNGYHVKVFDKSFDKNFFKDDGVEFIKGDFFKEEDIKGAVEDVDYVYHYISSTIPQSSIKNPLKDNENVIGSIKLFEIASDYGVKKIIFPSSGGTVYGETKTNPTTENHPNNPINPYGISKLSIERYLFYFYSNYGLDYTIFRYSNPYGPRQDPNGHVGLIPVILELIKKDKRPIIFGDGKTVRDYVFIEDAAKVNLLAIEKKTKHKIFNVGSGIGYSINDILEKIFRITGKTIEPLYSKPRLGDVSKVTLDTSLIKREMNWEPLVDIDSGINKTWKWLNK